MTKKELLEKANRERKELLKDLDILTHECKFYCERINELNHLINRIKKELTEEQILEGE